MKVRMYWPNTIWVVKPRQPRDLSWAASSHLFSLRPSSWQCTNTITKLPYIYVYVVRILPYHYKRWIAILLNDNNCVHSKHKKGWGSPSAASTGVDPPGNIKCTWGPNKVFVGVLGLLCFWGFSAFYIYRLKCFGRKSCNGVSQSVNYGIRASIDPLDW